jgi:mannose-1-phosphate guanylyltransferase/phosphomannomutase
MRTDNGWVYLVPLARRSALRVLAEGPDLELAAELCDHYARRVAALDRAHAPKPGKKEFFGSNEKT